METEFIGRQPIVNRNQAILGYRLLYGGASDVQYDPTQKKIAIPVPERNLALQFEEVLSGATGFVEVDIEALNSEFVDALEPKQFVIEIGSLEGHDAKAVAKRCRELRKRGLRICLGNYQRRDNRQILLEHASYIKIDAIATSDSEVRTIVRRMRSSNVKIMASRVDLPSQFDNLVDRGIDLFQGYFYARHDPETERELSPDRATIVDLLTRSSTGVELSEIDDAFKRNANLSVSLLRLVNGLQLARSNKIDTVSQALVMIGTHGLSRWLNILLFAGGAEDGPPSPLFKLASTRGRLMELLQLDLLGPDPDREQLGIANRAFLIGMLSLAHVVLGVSEQKALDELNLSKEIRSALDSYQGQAGVLLRLTKCIEASDHDTAQEIRDALGLSREQLKRAQLESFSWVNAL
ncbi:MAG: EAL domain-containing protein [Myxococcales bacterium]|nr:EAL domain-containing protein [Myxococcales bacterium]